MVWSLEDLKRKVEMDRAEEEFREAVRELDRAKEGLQAELGISSEELDKLIEMRRKARRADNV